MEKGNKKIVNAWCWYDWANSVYPLVITTAVFPIYFGAVTKTGEVSYIEFLGRDIVNTEFYSYLVALSFLMVAMISPVLSGIADYAGRKRLFMQIFSSIGALASISLFFFTGRENLWIGVLGSIMASIGFAGSLVFYNAFLPEIAAEKDMDKVSARGFTMGYIGSSILLILCFVVIMMPGTFGIPDLPDGKPNTGLATRISFMMAGLWWLGFAQIAFAGLPARTHDRVVDSKKLLSHGYKELAGVMRQLRLPAQRKILLFLAGFFFCALGYMTVIYLATLFGEKEVGMTSSELMITVLIIQFVAIGGSYLFAGISSKLGNIPAIMISAIIWALVCCSTFFVTDKVGFYVVAFFVGTVMGGIQALARSTYAKLLPETEDHASYYSFYELTEKVATATGTFSYGIIINLTGTMRNASLFLGLMFLVGIVFLFFAHRAQRVTAS
ncbi:MAG TPA: MFS transporter [Bacteroidia bacterium]|nr:MFS transporter [Bacteroidia bacterium]